jgi:nucleoside-diphosphate-sugar epimerase
MIAEELDVPAPRLRLPLRPVLLAADLCERIFVPFKREPPLHRRRVSFFQNNRAFTVRKAKEVLGFRPSKSLREGLRSTIGWYRQQGWI